MSHYIDRYGTLSLLSSRSFPAALINEAIAVNPTSPDVQPQVDALIQRLSAIFKTLEQDVTVF